MSAKLHFKYGSMNTGKSTQLLQVAHNYEQGGHTVAVYTAAIDNRAGIGVVASRLGVSRPALLFDQSTDFLKELRQLDVMPSCILVDEAQFLSGQQVRDLHKIAATQGVPVLAFGLRSDFQGAPFEGALHLLTLAEDLQEIKAICDCGRKSTMNIRIDENGRRKKHGAQILIGGNNRYRQVCAKCFYADET